MLARQSAIDIQLVLRHHAFKLDDSVFAFTLLRHGEFFDIGTAERRLIVAKAVVGQFLHSVGQIDAFIICKVFSRDIVFIEVGFKIPARIHVPFGLHNDLLICFVI